MTPTSKQQWIAHMQPYLHEVAIKNFGLTGAPLEVRLSATCSGVLITVEIFGTGQTQLIYDEMIRDCLYNHIEQTVALMARTVRKRFARIENG